MEPLSNLGKIMTIAGAIILLFGLILWSGFRVPFLGKLPGDIAYKSKNFAFYFPLVSSILLSVFLSLILYLIRKFF